MEKNPIENLIYHGGYTGIFRRIGFVGDSLSSGEFESKDENGVVDWYDMYEYSWGQFIGRKCGLEAFNFSMGGMTARQFRTEHFAQHCGFLDRSKVCQAYVIALGVNDIMNAGHPMGTLADICLEDYNKNADTFAGNYGKIIQRYKEIQPDAKFFLVTKPKDNRDERNPFGADDISNLLYEMAELFPNTYVIDWRKYGPVCDEEFRKRFFVGGHMNAAGYLMTAKIISSYIDYIIRHDFEAFSQIGFVGTPYKY